MLAPDFETQLRDFLLQLEGVEVDTKRLDGYEVFRVPGEADADQRIFAILKTGSRPLVVDLASDRNLARTLRERYESVLPSKLMNPATWNRILASGQLTGEEVIDLARLAYNLTPEP